MKATLLSLLLILSSANADPWLLLSFPGDLQWCALLSVPEGGSGPSFAMICDGEIWLASDPPVYAGEFTPAVSADQTSFSHLKIRYSGNIEQPSP
ncbi:MAG: hypothetical protein QF492_02805 [Candidatus Krumholzibacteria bacterium]|jgi:hypothetical protein|nr:hypothetical protein [Candidatus Krumholzibacteria bacterium]MDP6668828.1 hypothetical protein [Candidatus Krumholzibacteria bacterium]MDP6796392.1 hypothetical protein [Candidatus Krumholzibacteria bacterium]MDP7022027.1 hypothetical protein [Candidatus Krumholzibacteria bacterium]